jgi:signal transduction histidine kinase
MKDAFWRRCHELRTPLQSIVSYVYLLQSGKLSSERRTEALNAVQRNAEIQSRLIESLLDLSDEGLDRARAMTWRDRPAARWCGLMPA